MLILPGFDFIVNSEMTILKLLLTEKDAQFSTGKLFIRQHVCSLGIDMSNDILTVALLCRHRGSLVLHFIETKIGSFWPKKLSHWRN